MAVLVLVACPQDEPVLLLQVGGFVAAIGVGVHLDLLQDGNNNVKYGNLFRFV